MKIARIHFFIVLFLLAGQVHAQRQKVGVVLSGGGSSGLAHIGVLKALEENGIPIDYIAGTSAGALVGAMYASGFTPDEMWKLALSDEFYNMAKGIIGEDYKYYFKTRDPDPTWLNVRFSLDSGLHASIPTNLVEPYGMDLGMIQFFAQASAVAGYNFDSLMVPFRCIAADVLDKKQVVWRTGDLCQAVRSSTTYPLYMRPIIVDGKMLFDGGLYNNFPSDVVLEDFYPDLIIGSTVANSLKPPKSGDLGSQLKALLMHNTNYDAVCDNGIIIRPEIPDVPVMDFTRNHDIIEGGYRTAINQISEIKALVHDRVSPDEVAAKRAKFQSRKPPLVFNEIKITGLNKYQSEYVVRSLRHSQDLVTFNELKRSYFNLVADDKLKNIYPKATFNQNTGFFDLYLDIERDKDIIASIGGNIASRSINQAFIGLEYKFLGRFSLSVLANTHIGKFYTSGQLRGRLDVPSRVPFFIEGGITLNQWNYFESFSAFFEETRPSFLVQTERYAVLDAGLPMGTKIKFISSIGWANISNQYYLKDDFTRDDRPDNATVNLMTTATRLERNTLNRRQYANSGRAYMARFRVNWGREVNQPGTTAISDTVTEKDHVWLSARLKYEQYFKILKPLRIGILAEVLVSSQGFFSNYTSSVLMAPVFQPTPETSTLFLEQFRATQWAAVGGRIVYTIWKQLDARVEAYTFHPYRRFVQNPDQSAANGPVIWDPRFLGMAGVVFNSPVGPISLMVNYHQKEQTPWSVLFHIGYILFNNRALE